MRYLHNMQQRNTYIFAMVFRVVCLSVRPPARVLQYDIRWTSLMHLD